MFLDLLQQELGEYKTAAGEIRFCCPFCGETKYRFYVHEEKGLWTCHRCKEKGNPVSFVKEYYNVSFPEAADILATFDYDAYSEKERGFNTEQFGSGLTKEEQLLLFISREGRPLEEDKEEKLVCPPPPTNCKPLMANFNNPEAFPFFTYLHRRGVTLGNIKRHNISYVTDGEVSLINGKTLRLSNHVVFFTHDSTGKPVYWNTRSIELNPFIKSFNAPSREGEYSKKNTIFNLNNAKHTDKIIIHEGVFNSFMTPDSGVATFGKMITEGQVELLLRETRERKLPIYIFLDTDAWKDMIDSARMIKQMEPDREVYFVYSGLDEDANDLGFEKCQELLRNAFPADSQGELRLTLMNSV